MPQLTLSKSDHYAPDIYVEGCIVFFFTVRMFVCWFVRHVHNLKMNVGTVTYISWSSNFVIHLEGFDIYMKVILYSNAFANVTRYLIG